ncbi:MAG: glutaredoxin 3 [Gammaproteobacteria bacterium]|nr:glutaredoxin 3 [Gammaproteobacteria bacterium]
MSAPEIDIYTTQFCPFCVRAKMLLDKKGVAYNEIPVDQQPEKRSEMEQRSGGTSVPQIFINGKHIGGCDEMYELEMDEELDKLLGTE